MKLEIADEDIREHVKRGHHDYCMGDRNFILDRAAEHTRSNHMMIDDY